MGLWRIARSGSRVCSIRQLIGELVPGSSRISSPRFVSGVRDFSQHQRNLWEVGKRLSNHARRELEWMRLRSSVGPGSFGGSNFRHFGGGGYYDSQTVLWSLVGANVGVFVLWRILKPDFMNSNFVVSEQALRSGRLHTLITSAFSQYELNHLLSNMVGLYFFGSEIGRIFGGQKLVLLYLTGGVVGALSHVGYWAVKNYQREGTFGSVFSRNYSPGLLGSSGAVNAIILLDILLFPKRIVYLNLFLPIPAALFGLVIVGSDLWAAIDGKRQGTSASGHLGGAAVGVVAFFLWRFR